MSKIVKDASQKIDSYFYSLENPEVREICMFLRILINKADATIIEDWKWGPCFNKNGIICWVGGFKTHANLAFYKGALLKDKKQLLLPSNNLHNRSIKFTAITQVKPKIIIDYVKEAVELNNKGIEIPKVSRIINIPEEIESVLKKYKLIETFNKLTYIHKKEYIDWATSAKKEETKERRLAKLITHLQNSIKQ